MTTIKELRTHCQTLIRTHPDKTETVLDILSMAIEECEDTSERNAVRLAESELNEIFSQ
jgi:hypothetical protein